MSKSEGTAHGRHYTEEEKENDSQRNFNQSKGRNHWTPDPDEKAGGHSDRHASATSDSGGQQHEFRREKNDDDANRHDTPQSEGRMQGSSRSTGQQGGRNQSN